MKDLSALQQARYSEVSKDLRSSDGVMHPKYARGKGFRAVKPGFVSLVQSHRSSLVRRVRQLRCFMPLSVMHACAIFRLCRFGNEPMA